MMKMRVKTMFWKICELGLIGLLAAVSFGPARAQQSQPTSAAPAIVQVSKAAPDVRAKTDTSEADTRYRIGPGDVLDVRVVRAPELSREAVRVDQRGMIRMPMLETDIRAACLTESELAANIAKLYLEYKREPHVDVFVKEFESQPVAVMGAVEKPGQFRLQRQVRLLELLSFAGGPSEKAGRIVHLIHGGGPNLCHTGPAESDAEAALPGQEVLNLNDIYAGRVSNPFLRPGDIISLPEADQVFVVGYVYQPRSIPLKDKTITVSRAVAMAGGPQRDSKPSKVRIVRQIGDGPAKEEIVVDLKAIESHKAVDIVLLPNDIVNVPSSTGKMLLNSLTGAIVPIMSTGAVRAIP